MPEDKRTFEPKPCDVMVQMKGSSENTPVQCYEHEIPILEDIHGAGSVKKYKRIVHSFTREVKADAVGRIIRKSEPAKYKKLEWNVAKEAARLDAKYGSGRGEIFLSAMNMLGAKSAATSGTVTMD